MRAASSLLQLACATPADAQGITRGARHLALAVGVLAGGAADAQTLAQLVAPVRGEDASRGSVGSHALWNR